MKKLCIAILLCLFTLPLSAFMTIESGNPNSYYAPLLDLFATGVNSGLAGSTIPPKIATVGFQVNFAMNGGGGVFQQTQHKDNYFFPLLYANFHIGDFLLFARGFAIDQKGASFWYLGGGLGYIVSDYKLFFPQIRILGAYNMLKANASNNDVKISTITANAIADYKLPIPILSIHILANLAYERNMMDVSWTALTKSFGVNRMRFSVGAQTSLFWVLNLSYEYTILPNSNHNLGISFGF